MNCKKVVATTVLLVLAMPVFANPALDHNAIVDQFDAPVASSSTNSSGVTTYRAASGRELGTSSTNSSGITTYRTSSGRELGSANTNSSGATTYRKPSGKETGSSYTDSNGSTVYKHKN